MPIEQKAATLAEPDASLFEMFGAYPTRSGPAVTPQTAMRVPAVSAAVGLISTTVGTLPAKVFRRDDQGTKQAAPDHVAYSLVRDAANDWTSAGELRAQLTADALLHGAGYAVANRLSDHRVVEFVRLQPGAGTVTCETDALTGEPRYRVQTGQGQRIYGYRDVLHIPAFGGVAPIVLAREAIGLALVLEQHAAQLFAKGARPGSILSFKQALSLESLNKHRAVFSRAFSGDGSGGIAVLDADATFTPVAFTSVDSEYAATRAFQIEEISRAFRVPSTFLGKLDRATFHNTEEMNAQFLAFTLLPWLRVWEAAYRRVLLTPEERSSTTIEFVVDDLLRADTATRAEAYAKFRQMGAMTANEVRARENLPALPGGDTLDNPFVSPAGLRHE